TPAKPEFTASELWGVIKGEARTVALTRELWESTLTEHGLKGKAGSGEQWRFRDATGEVRATGFFLDGGNSFFVLFFPAERHPTPEALLTHFTRVAVRSEFDNGDTLTLTLPQEPLSRFGCKGTSTESVTVRLADGSLVRSSVVVECKINS